MSKFDVCPICGATLDHGETCDCNCEFNKEETQEACVCQKEEKIE